MPDSATRPVVVGVDGSFHSDIAVRLAARMATERALPLEVIHALTWPVLDQRSDRAEEAGPTDWAETIVAESVRLARQTQPDVVASGRVVEGWPAAVLVNASADAAMLVVGDRGLGGFASLLLGSVAVEVSSHVTCPVVIARGVVDRPTDVLVGVDGSQPSRRAADFAFNEAGLRGVGFVALHAYAVPSAIIPPSMRQEIVQLENHGYVLLFDVTRDFAKRSPDVRVRRLVRRERPAAALIEESRRAGLLVVGSRGVGGFRGLLLGSVAHAMMHHAESPVVIVR